MAFFLLTCLFPLVMTYDLEKCAINSTQEIDCHGEDPSLNITLREWSGIKQVVVQCPGPLLVQRPRECPCLPNPIDCRGEEVDAWTFKSCPIPSQQGAIAEVMEKCGSLSAVASVAFTSYSGQVPFSPHLFAQLTNLTSLSLVENNFTTLPKDIFHETKNLKKLWLDDDNSEDGEYLIIDLTNLEELELGMYAIKSLESSSHLNQHTLKQLNLSSNAIKSLDNHTFQDLYSLEWLDLSTNHLKDLDEDLLAGNPLLTELVLKENLISVLPEFLFHSNAKLQKLELQGNLNLMLLPGLLFEKTPFLSHLNLNNCNLTDSSLDPKLFTFTPELDYLDLGRNKLKEIKAYWFKNLAALKTLRLSHNRIVAIKPGSFSSLHSLHYLHLDHNQLIRLDGSGWRGVPKLLELNLEDNQLNSIDGLRLLPELQRLNLSSNRLTRLPQHVVDWWNSSTLTTSFQVWLAGNAWHCDCNLVSLFDLMMDRRRLFDSQRLTCQDDLVLANVDRETLCTAPHSSVVLTSVGVACLLLLLALGLMGGLLMRRWRTLQAWLYNRRLCLSCLPSDEEVDDEADEVLAYDAFVSYSNEDEKFVADQLVPNLERPGSGLPTFKLCLHFRDWVAGEWIPNQIQQSVASSRRTLIVLSEHFLRSTWAQLEFRTAYQQAVRDPHRRLIVVVLGDLPDVDAMGTELKSYVSLHTYLKWGDPFFWDRLRYALPHRRSGPHRRSTRATRENVDTCQTRSPCPSKIERTESAPCSIELQSLPTGKR